ncbi:MAG: lactonase family protein [Actinobacteria bacterium]|nr:lactonase family protein [Actinomycetota bacterium]
MSSRIFYVGTYTGTLPHVVGRSDGIQIYELAGGRLEHLGWAPAENPSLVTTDSSGSTLYAVNELLEYKGEAQGAVSAFRISPDGSLSLLGQRGSGGTGPCHVSVDRHDRWVMVANYYGGSVAVYPCLDDGSLGELRQLIQHEGAAMVNPTRQEKAHAHLILTDAGNRFAYVPDLGIDQVVIYRLTDGADGDVLVPGPPPLKMAPGAGPRHLAFHPDGAHAVIINELDSTVVAVAIDPDDGSLTPVAVASTLPPGYSGESTCAEVAITPDGRFVYGSNRGHDSIVVLAFDASSLEPVGWAPSGGRTPRHFALDPTGETMVVANQDSGTLAVFAVDGDDGLPRPTGEVARCATPVYVRFLEAPVAG